MDKLPTILENIMAYKRQFVAEASAKCNLSDLRQIPDYKRITNKIMLPQDSQKIPSILAEYKRKSPSKGLINGTHSAVEIGRAYAEHGAIGMSVLTDEAFFGGCNQDLMEVRAALPSLAILRKEFIVDAYQIEEAKAMGADLILLIAECLDKKTIAHFTQVAHDLDLQVLLELHSVEQLDKIPSKVDLVGVNNRNLHTFDVSLETSLSLFDQLPTTALPVTESGIHSAKEAMLLFEAGFPICLIGEQFMKTDDPGAAFAKFVNEMKNLSKNEQPS